MFKDGTYSAWFKTSLGEGTGIVHFADGMLWGRDSIISYGGSYQVDGDRFAATVTTKRHTAGHPTVFGIDEIELQLVGTAKGTIVTCQGTTDAAPGMVLEVTLIFNQGSSAARDTARPAVKFDPSKLPRLPKRFPSR